MDGAFSWRSILREKDALLLPLHLRSRGSSIRTRGVLVRSLSGSRVSRLLLKRHRDCCRTDGVPRAGKPMAARHGKGSLCAHRHSVLIIADGGKVSGKINIAISPALSPYFRRGTFSAQSSRTKPESSRRVFFARFRYTCPSCEHRIIVFIICGGLRCSPASARSSSYVKQVFFAAPAVSAAAAWRRGSLLSEERIHDCDQRETPAWR